MSASHTHDKTWTTAMSEGAWNALSIISSPTSPLYGLGHPRDYNVYFGKLCTSLGYLRNGFTWKFRCWCGFPYRTDCHPVWHGLPHSTEFRAYYRKLDQSIICPLYPRVGQSGFRGQSLPGRISGVVLGRWRAYHAPFCIVM